MQILLRTNDTTCLRNLVLASPSYHAVYRSGRDKVFTAVTVKELTARSVDILAAYDVYQVVFENEPTWEGFKNIQAAMTIIYDHYRSPGLEKKARYPVLSIEQSLELRQVQKLIPWETELMPDRREPSEKVLTIRIPKDTPDTAPHIVVCCADRVVFGLDTSQSYYGYEMLRGEIGPSLVDTKERLRWYYDPTGRWCKETMT